MDFSLNSKRLSLAGGAASAAVYGTGMGSYYWLYIDEPEATGHWDWGLWQHCHTLGNGDQLCSKVELSFFGPWATVRVILSVAVIFMVMGFIYNLRSLGDVKNSLYLATPSMWILAGVTVLIGCVTFALHPPFWQTVSWSFWVTLVSGLAFLTTGLVFGGHSIVSKRERDRVLFVTPTPGELEGQHSDQTKQQKKEKQKA